MHSDIYSQNLNIATAFVFKSYVTERYDKNIPCALFQNARLNVQIVA